MLLNEDTAELIRFTTLAEIPGGTWLLRRPVRTYKARPALFVTARVIQRPAQASLITFRPNVFASFLKPSVTPSPLEHHYPDENVGTGK
jgi:hypothetical protein